ncbi:VOC family protein [Actinomycetospora endophytica]|uniref:VOC family protein n=1 Tax=Actinomycetospora endophytica TaxID=2291215 RepID=A0ABS8P4I0_9PSEU|nr:VOC family protein [Actinomycetospora endophytica]MCD2192455.1 VOC family protein [Actinomycetospora endophytica]
MDSLVLICYHCDMPTVVLALPTDDRVRAHAFYRDGLGLTAVGPPGDDGVPEPLQVVVSDGLHLMFIPRGGFGWVTGDNAVAAPGTSECLLSLPADDDAGVDAALARAEAAGATVVTRPATMPWGHLATFADPDGHLWQVIHAPGW